MAIRTLIVDDNAHFLDAARDVLEREGITIVRTASTSPAARRLVGEHRPDLVLIDIDLGDEKCSTRRTIPIDDCIV